MTLYPNLYIIIILLTAHNNADGTVPITIILNNLYNLVVNHHHHYPNNHHHHYPNNHQHYSVYRVNMRVIVIVIANIIIVNLPIESLYLPSCYHQSLLLLKIMV